MDFRASFCLWTASCYPCFVFLAAEGFFFGEALCPKEKNSSFPKSFCDWTGTELKGSLAPPCLLNAVTLAEVLRTLDRFPTSSGRGLLSGECLSGFASLGSLLLCYMM